MNELNKNQINKIRKYIKENLAQKPNECDRLYPEKNSKHLGNNLENYALRDAFSHDADRILYSKAFRRLEHKAQVYSNKRGDHYMTRLTHTLIVTQIARSISRNLGLNEHLTEAIALGHDIGHTPFGHAGEEVLDDIMRGKDHLGGKIELSIDYGGFKHNFNCLKIVEIVEKRHENNGLNLTWQTLDGILKHTSIRKNNKKWDLSRFINDTKKYKPFIDYYYYDDNVPEFEFPLTLEGQVVAISDEIAQRTHDLEDSLRDGNIFKFEELHEEIKSILSKIPEIDSKQGYETFKQFYKKVSNLKIDNGSPWKEMSSMIISYFIIDITENTLIKINSYQNENKVINDDKYVLKELINFSEIAKQVNENIKKFIEKRIIYSFDVNRFDAKGKYVLRKLFKAYYENPRQMPKKQLKILIDHIQKIKDEYGLSDENFDYLGIDFDELINVDENNIDYNNLDKMLNILKLNLNDEFYQIKVNIEKNPEILKEFDNKYNYKKDSSFYEKLFENCNKYTLKGIKNIEDYEIRKVLLVLKGLSELHYAYLSTICDYISQMTDDYAIKEYKELYLSD